MTAPTPSSIVIAVSGHRALHAGDCARLRDQLDAALADIAQAAPDARLDCLSALAAGADQLFAQQVLALQHKLGPQRIRLLVPLPMPETAYIESQEQPGSTAFRDSFLALRARAQHVFEVPANGGAPTGAAPYVRLGDYFAAHADVLVALWDGDTGAERQPGGTYDVVMRCLAVPGRRVVHLPARRAGGADLAVAALPGLLTLDADGGLRRCAQGQ
jgi:methylmalonyl-CoA mutase cobalamin-binding subunit